MHFILGTAGHIDHGKSSLIKALTGINPDRLPEEQKRGVTIELGFAHLQIGGHEIGVVDVPGHADFVNNMVCGVSTLNLAIFVIAADDGWMPQSEEHLHILSYLGIDKVIIALTKIDTCEDVDFSIEMVREELVGSSLENCTIIPVSSHTGEGLTELKEAICLSAESIKHDIKGRFPRLYVDRVFSPQGVGTVVTGTLAGSELSVTDPLIAYPILQKTSVRHIQMHSSSSETASPGSRVGLNLSDLSINQRGKPGISRGCTLAPAGLNLSSTLNIELVRMQRSIPGQSATLRALKNTESVILHHGTARVKARVILSEGTKMEPGEKMFAQLRLEEPLAVCIGDHFILRDGGQQGTLGGGTILEVNAEPRKFRTTDRKAILERRLGALATCRNLLLDELNNKGYLPINSPITNSPYSESALHQAIQKLTQEKKAQKKDTFIFEKAWWKNALQAAEKIIKDYHTSYPDISAMPFEDLRSSMKKLNYQTETHPPIEDTLLNGDFLKKESGIYHKDHNLELPSHLKAIENKIITELEIAGLNPPIFIEFINTPEKQQVLQYLVKSNIVTQLSAKAIILTSEFNKAVDAILDLLQSQEVATSSEIRQTLGLTRKVLIPLLELMDEKQLTVRDGDLRKLNK